MEPKNLILLTEKESKIAIDIGLRGELEIYIIDTAKNLPHLLRIGELDEIRQSIPERTIITLDPPPTGHLYIDMVKLGILTLELLKINTRKFLKGNPHKGAWKKRKARLLPQITLIY